MHRSYTRYLLFFPALINILMFLSINNSFAQCDVPPCDEGEIEVHIQITTDGFGNETHWVILDNTAGTGCGVGTIPPGCPGGVLGPLASNFTYDWFLCYPAGNNLDFVIYDRFCDGICCGFGIGSYTVELCGGIVVASGGAFGYSETTNFTLPANFPFLHPTTGLQGTFVGNCMAVTCNSTYYDDGGCFTDYSNSITQIYRTFCPDVAGNCVTATFTQFDVEAGAATCGGVAGCWDALIVKDGPTQNSPDIWAGCGTAIPGPFTSTDPSGCLTFRFCSDGAFPRPGWAINLSCTPCAGPNGSDNNDCINSTAICSDASFAGSSSGPGITSEGCAGCQISEHYSTWYFFEIQASGTMALNIVPVDATDDYDLALYQAADCGSLGTPVRCSYAATTGNTGMVSGAGDNSEDVTGDGWVNDIAVTLGEQYFLMVNNWTPNGDGFTLNWTLTGGASMDCAVLPIELLTFGAKLNGAAVNIYWTTVSETNNDYFTIERSAKGEIFEILSIVDGAGNSNKILSYSALDEFPYSGISYYRLKQTDFDGTVSYSNMVSIKINQLKFEINFLSPLPAQDNVIINFDSDSDDQVNLKIFDLIGKELLSKSYNAHIGSNSLLVDIIQLPKGVYFLYLDKRGKSVYSKLIK